MMVDTQVYAYLFEGYVVCPACADTRYCPKHGREAYDSNGDCGRPVYSHDDDGYGLTCDTCGDIVFETWPDVAHEMGDHDGVRWQELEDECEHCADYGREHSLHGGPDMRPWEHIECDDCVRITRVLRIGHGEWESHLPGSTRACEQCVTIMENEAKTEELGL